MRTVRLVFTSFSAYPDLIKSWLKPSHWKFFPVSATVQLPLSHLKNLTFICAYYVSWLILRSWIPSSSSQGLTFHLYILHTFFLKDDGINFTEKYLEVREGSWKIVCDLRCFISSSCFLQNFFFFFFALDICTKKGLRKINIQLELFQVPNHCCMTEKYFIVITCKPLLWRGKHYFTK